MSDDEKRVGVTVVFSEGEPFTCEMTLLERDRLHTAYLAYVNTDTSPVRGGSFDIWERNEQRKVALDFRTIKLIY